MPSSGVSSDGNGRLGFGLRYRPVPAFALETDFDFVSGTDWNGYRTERVRLTVNASSS